MIVIVNLKKVSSKKLLIVCYLVFLGVGGFYVSWALKNEPVKEKQQTKKPGQKVWLVNVSLTVTQGARSGVYTTTLKNINSVADLLETIRRDGKLTYEKSYYTYGTVLVSVNDVRATDGYKWGLFIDNQDVTEQAGTTDLVDGGSYTIKLVKI